jgi:lysophospholipase
MTLSLSARLLYSEPYRRTLPMTLVSIPANPVPDGAVLGFLKTPDGRILRFVRWEPPAGRQGTLCVFQGRAEFIEKYFEVVRDALDRGFAVAMIDWRGQGLSDRALSDPRKGHVGNFSEFDVDLETFIRDVVLPDCPPPFFALAHSMGGAVLLRAARQGRRWFDRIVLSAPMIGLAGRPGTSSARTSARLLRLMGLGYGYIPGGGATAVTSSPFVGNDVTSDPVRYARTAAIVDTEPKLGLGSPTIGWVDAAFRAMGEFADPSYPAQTRLPILIVAAGQDTIVSTPAIGQFAVRLRVGSHLVIAGARHEILMEQDRFRSQFWAAFDAFVPGSPLFG